MNIRKEKSFLNIFVLFVSFIISLFVADKILQVFHYDADQNTDRATYPPNFVQHIQFINSFYELKTNSLGIRYAEIPLQKESPDEVRIAVIGDSFVEGEGVEARDTFSAKLERIYKKNGENIRFINCGIRGAGPNEYLEVLNTVAIPYHADKVLLCLFANDLEDTYSAFDWTKRTSLKVYLEGIFPRLYPLLRKFYHDQLDRWTPQSVDVISETLKQAELEQIPQDKISAWLKRLPDWDVRMANEERTGQHRLTAGLLEPDYWTMALDVDSQLAKVKWRAMRRILDRIRLICLSKNIELRVMFFPSPYQYDPSFDPLPEALGVQVRKEWLNGRVLLQEHLEQWADENSTAFLDVTNDLRKRHNEHGALLNYRIDIHWTPAGHAVVTRAVLHWLKKTGFLLS